MVGRRLLAGRNLYDTNRARWAPRSPKSHGNKYIGLGDLKPVYQMHGARRNVKASKRVFCYYALYKSIYRSELNALAGLRRLGVAVVLGNSLPETLALERSDLKLER